MKCLDKGEIKLENVDPSDIVKVVKQFSPYLSLLSKKYFVKDGTNDDLFEEGVIGLLQACKNYKGESLFDEKFNAFAKVCIKRQILDAIKKSNTQKNKVLNDSISYTELSYDDSGKSLLDTISDPNISTDPLEVFIDKEKMEEKLKICDEELNDFEKQVLKFYLEGDKQSEIARMLGREIKQIDNTLQRIKSKLNKTL